MIGRTLRGLGLAATAAVMAASAGWGTLALAYYDHVNESMRTVLAGAFGLASLAALAAFAVGRWRGRAVALHGISFATVLAAWLAIEPSNDRNWRAEEAVLPYATVDGDRVTVHNIRNFDYRSEADFTVAHYDRTFDLRELDSVDLLAVYWMGPDIAHVMLSFGFAGRDHLTVSIEVRKEKGEAYSTIKGFFRQYELYYVVADERDVVRVRTNYRRDPPEDVYLYRVASTREGARRLFMDYLDEINSLARRPEFYNTLTTNCTTNIWMHSRVNATHLPFSWKILASGHVPELLYEAGRLDRSVPFEQLRERSRINDLAQAADRAPDFSQRIRARLTPR